MIGGRILYISEPFWDDWGWNGMHVLYISGIFATRKNVITTMKRTIVCIFALLVAISTQAQQRLSLDDCHRLALESNKSIKISQERVAAAEDLKHMAFWEMMPRVSANGTYNWNQKSIQLLSDEQQDRINHMGSNMVDEFAENLSSTGQTLAGLFPQLAETLRQDLQNSSLANTLNHIGQDVTSATQLDLTNVYAGAVTVTQPVFMGGKLVELYKTARAASEMAELSASKELDEILIKVDEAYWRVISVQKKQQLAQQYCDLLDTMYHNVMVLHEAEMATEADITKVRVKLNEAQMSLAKANSGLALSKMLLYQMCGLDLMGNYEVVESVNLKDYQSMQSIDMEDVYANRNEIKMLQKGGEIANSGVKIAAAGLMPNLMVTGNYVVTNPNMFNGVSNEFGGMFTVGAVLNVPICHPTAIYSVKAAKHKRNEVQYQIQQAREMIELQVNKLNYELAVANSKLTQAQTNLKNAGENLNMAQESFAAGVISSSDLMAAQTAWLSASSELLDAGIEVQMDYLYLNQALGR